MNNLMIKPYVQVEDSHGAVASVYFLDDLNHQVHYVDDTGTKFFTEEYESLPIELVEKNVIDWAEGRRILV